MSQIMSLLLGDMMIMDIEVEVCLHAVRIMNDPQDLVKAMAKIP